MKVDLYIGDSKLDLFEDENIEINLSVVDIENIESNTTEFTKDFTVPASNSNNRLFQHYYNADIDNGFDARVKVDGTIFINGFLFKLGKYRLSKVIVKDNNTSVTNLLFSGCTFLGIGLTAGHDMYDNACPSGGIITGIGQIHNRDVMVICNDSTVKGGTYYPITVKIYIGNNVFIARLTDIYEEL